MAKYTNVVRFRVKSCKQRELRACSATPKREARNCCISEQKRANKLMSPMVCGRVRKMVDARPQMIRLLDSTRHLLEELSPELDVTDHVSGNVVFQKLGKEF